MRYVALEFTWLLRERSRTQVYMHTALAPLLELLDTTLLEQLDLIEDCTI